MCPHIKAYVSVCIHVKYHLWEQLPFSRKVTIAAGQALPQLQRGDEQPSRARVAGREADDGEAAVRRGDRGLHARRLGSHGEGVARSRVPASNLQGDRSLFFSFDVIAIESSVRLIFLYGAVEFPSNLVLVFFFFFFRCCLPIHLHSLLSRSFVIYLSCVTAARSCGSSAARWCTGTWRCCAAESAGRSWTRYRPFRSAGARSGPGRATSRSCC